NNFLYPLLNGVDIKAAKANVTVQGNFFLPLEYDFMVAHVVVRDNIEPGTAISLQNNAFNGHQYYGVIVTRTDNAQILSNVFTPAPAADFFTHVHLNTRYVANTSPDPLYPPYNGTSAFIKGNLFNGPSVIDDGGTAIEIANFDTRCNYEDVVVGGPGSDANTFAAKLRYVVKMDPRTGTTNDLVIAGVHIADVANPGSETDVGPANFDVDFSQNLFGVNRAPAGTYVPGNMTQDQLFEIEDKVQHHIDWADLGFVNIKNNESFVTEHNDLDSLGAVASVQRGLNVVPAGGRVNVEPTTLFNEALIVNKDFTLDAENFALIQNVVVNGGDATLDGDLRVNGTLTLTDGLINTGASEV
ncbi:MAG: hypothetical protein RMM53_13660, partial [Bacteroidia bacterium]|nr:hypothetical protein [Bacteroidia bacterium]